MDNDMNKPFLDKPLLDQTWNAALDAAASDCEQEALGHRSANSGGDGTEPGWKYAEILDRAAASIRGLKR